MRLTAPARRECSWAGLQTAWRAVAAGRAPRRRQRGAADAARSARGMAARAIGGGAGECSSTPLPPQQLWRRVEEVYASAQEVS